eukprot:2358675-Rhodomonas_salina.1
MAAIDEDKGLYLWKGRKCGSRFSHTPSREVLFWFGLWNSVALSDVCLLLTRVTLSGVRVAPDSVTLSGVRGASRLQLIGYDRYNPQLIVDTDNKEVLARFTLQ